MMTCKTNEKWRDGAEEYMSWRQGDRLRDPITGQTVGIKHVSAYGGPHPSRRKLLMGVEGDPYVLMLGEYYTAWHLYHQGFRRVKVS